ncbi:MAG: hypothetical protein OXB96_01340 [Candidatus Kaiserbacteria bacterium]|nr:hypothetical protein [Candidatus Kaiserbacteria bacterium]
MKIFTNRESARQVIARKKQEELEGVKRKLPDHIAKKKEEAYEWKERVRQWKAYRNRLIEHQYRRHEKAFLEEKKAGEEEEYRRIEYDADTNRYHDTSVRGVIEGATDSESEKEKRWKRELWSAVRKEHESIIKAIEFGKEEEIREILQKKAFKYFDAFEVAEALRTETEHEEGIIDEERRREAHAIALKVTKNEEEEEKKESFEKVRRKEIRGAEVEIERKYRAFNTIIKNTQYYQESRGLEADRLVRDEQERIESAMRDFRALDMIYVSKERPRTFGSGLLPPEEERVQVRQNAIDNLVELLTGHLETTTPEKIIEDIVQAIDTNSPLHTQREERFALLMDALRQAKEKEVNHLHQGGELKVRNYTKGNERKRG